MVLFTPKKLTFKGSKKQHQILTQTAYYQAGKIVVQTILPEQPPVALITLNTLGTTCSTSADTYIPIENIYNTQSCSFLESRLVSLYGGKAASLLIEYQQRFTSPYHVPYKGKGLLPLYPIRVRAFTPTGSATEELDVVNHDSSTSTLRLASGVSTTNPQSTFNSYSKESFFYYKNESSLFDFVRIKAPIRCKAKKATSWVSKQNMSWGLLPHALQYLPQYLPHTQRVRSTQNKTLFHTTNGSKASDLQPVKFIQHAPTKRSFANLLHTPYGVSTRVRAFTPTGSVAEKLAKQRMSEESKADIIRKTKLINNVQNRILNPSELTLLQKKVKGKTRLVRTCFAGAGNNIFQSTLGNIEIQTATRLARIMVNCWNFYSLNKTSLYSLFTKYAPFPKAYKLNVLHSKVAINSSFVSNKLANFHYLPQYLATQDHPTLDYFYPYGREQLYPYGLAQLGSWQSKEGLLPQYLSHTQRVRGTQSKGAVRGQEQRDQEYIEKDNNLEENTNLKEASLLQQQSAADPKGVKLRKPLPLQGTGVKALYSYRVDFARKARSMGYAIAKESEAEGYAKYEYNVKVWGIKLKLKDKTSQENIIYRVYNNLYFAIVQSKNSLKICENKNSSYNIQRLSVENIGNYSQLNNSTFQLINSLQFSNLQRDRFYPNWFRLYLPDMEATKFLKNVANYYFSLALQTLTFPSTKYSYNFIFTSVFTSYSKGKRYTKQSLTSYYKFAATNPLPLQGTGVKDKSSICTCTYKICTASPFLTFLNKNTRKEKYKLFIPNIISYSYCPPSILVNSTTYKSNQKGFSESRNLTLTLQNSLQSDALQAPRVMRVDDIKNPNFTKDQLEPLNVPFSLFLENQIFPLNYNGFSIVEKELLYNALVNSSFAKAFYLINQNRQLLDFFVDYLLRFQILRQHQILYLFSTLLLGCNKIA